MNQPNRQAVATAKQLEYLAPQITNALTHIQHELNNTDGYPASTIGDDGSRGTNLLTSVEAAADKRWELAADRAQIYDDLTAIHSIVQSLAHVCSQTLRTRTTGQTEPEPEPEHPTCTADPGHAGYLVLLTEGGWHDTECRKMARSSRGGLCDACRMREVRWRARNNQPELEDERPQGDDIRLTEHDTGVVYARPA